MSDNDEKKLYFVQNGEMCSGWELGRISIQAEVKSGSGLADLFSRVFNIKEGEFLVSGVPDNGVHVLMSGVRVVKLEDLYETREEAADAYRDMLLGE